MRATLGAAVVRRVELFVFVTGVEYCSVPRGVRLGLFGGVERLACVYVLFLHIVLRVFVCVRAPLAVDVLAWVRQYCLGWYVAMRLAGGSAVGVVVHAIGSAGAAAGVGTYSTPCCMPRHTCRSGPPGRSGGQAYTCRAPFESVFRT